MKLVHYSLAIISTFSTSGTWWDAAYSKHIFSQLTEMVIYRQGFLAQEPEQNFSTCEFWRVHKQVYKKCSSGLYNNPEDISIQSPFMGTCWGPAQQVDYLAAFWRDVYIF